MYSKKKRVHSFGGWGGGVSAQIHFCDASQDTMPSFGYECVSGGRSQD